MRFRIDQRVQWAFAGRVLTGTVVRAYRSCGDIGCNRPTYFIRLDKNGAEWELCESILSEAGAAA